MKHLLIALALLCVASPSLAATCWVAEYSDMVIDAAGREVPVAREPAVTVQAVTSVDASTQSAALNSETRFVIITCDAQTFFVFGANPTATTSSFRLAADAETSRGVTRGASIKIAFCDNDCTQSVADQIALRIPRDEWKEGSAFTATANFRTRATAAASTPTTVKWRIDCLTTGREVLDWTTVAAASSASLSVQGSYNAIIDDANDVEVKQLTVMVDDGLSTQHRESVRWRVENLYGSP